MLKQVAVEIDERGAVRRRRLELAVAGVVRVLGERGCGFFGGAQKKENKQKSTIGVILKNGGGGGEGGRQRTHAGI